METITNEESQVVNWLTSRILMTYMLNSLPTTLENLGRARTPIIMDCVRIKIAPRRQHAEKSLQTSCPDAFCLITCNLHMSSLSSHFC